MSRTLHLVALILVVVGALNWGLVGLAQFDLVAALFGGSAAVLSRMVYVLVAVAEIVVLWAAVAATLVTFGRVAAVAAGLLVPYLLWVTYATALNGAIRVLN